MRRTIFTATALIFASASAFAAGEMLLESSQDFIDISVSANELAECRKTLKQVAGMPAVHDNGTPIFFNWGASDLPQVRCVVNDA
ncbi:hypothetical protein [Roseivivax sp. CAU 1753]